jgi:hypothetical protein
VRQECASLVGGWCQAAGKRIAPHLKGLMGPWFLLQVETAFAFSSSVFFFFLLLSTCMYVTCIEKERFCVLEWSQAAGRRIKGLLGPWCLLQVRI